MIRAWAAKRKTLYLSGVAAFFAITLGIPLIIWISEPPNCFDGEMNGDEIEIDCGGSCQLMCRSQVSPLSLSWSRSFKVAEGYYNAIAYVENPNAGIQATEVPYRFEIYDGDNVLIDSREGTTFITGTGPSPIFEVGIVTGSRVPRRTFFTFLEDPVWYKAKHTPKVRIEGEQVIDQATNPRIEAILRNDEPYDIYDVEVAVSAYDLQGNALAVSRTIVPHIEPRERKPIFFTWSVPLTETIARVEVIPRVPPQKE